MAGRERPVTKRNQEEKPGDSRHAGVALVVLVDKIRFCDPVTAVIVGVHVAANEDVAIGASASSIRRRQEVDVDTCAFTRRTDLEQASSVDEIRADDASAD